MDSLETPIVRALVHVLARTWVQIGRNPAAATYLGTYRFRIDSYARGTSGNIDYFLLLSGLAFR